MYLVGRGVVCVRACHAPCVPDVSEGQPHGLEVHLGHVMAYVENMLCGFLCGCCVCMLFYDLPSRRGRREWRRQQSAGSFASAARRSATKSACGVYTVIFGPRTGLLGVLNRESGFMRGDVLSTPVDSPLGCYAGGPEWGPEARVTGPGITRQEGRRGVLRKTALVRHDLRFCGPHVFIAHNDIT